MFTAWKKRRVQIQAPYRSATFQSLGACGGGGGGTRTVSNGESRGTIYCVEKNSSNESSLQKVWGITRRITACWRQRSCEKKPFHTEALYQSSFKGSPPLLLSLSSNPFVCLSVCLSVPLSLSASVSVLLCPVSLSLSPPLSSLSLSLPPSLPLPTTSSHPNGSQISDWWTQCLVLPVTGKHKEPCSTRRLDSTRHRRQRCPGQILQRFQQR